MNLECIINEARSPADLGRFAEERFRSNTEERERLAETQQTTAAPSGDTRNGERECAERHLLKRDFGRKEDSHLVWGP